MPEGAVYVGRPSRWGNPFQVGAIHYKMKCGVWTPVKIHDRDTAVKMFEEWALKETVPHWDFPREHVYIRHAIDSGELIGKDLACWCPPGEPCHADVLLKIANEVS